MKTLMRGVLLGALVLSVMSNVGYASDYGDAPGYGLAYNTTPAWQKLGLAWDDDTEAESLAGVPDASDDGVSWSTDGGQTWGHDILKVGQTVTFKFDLYSHNTGTHSYDGLRSWIDWNGDKNWDASEMIISDTYVKTDGAAFLPDESDGGSRNWAQGDYGDWIKVEFFATVTVPDLAHLGDTWLRARVACDFSFDGSKTMVDGLWYLQPGDIENMQAYGYLHQGETEDWKLTVGTPEPTTLLLLGSGLLGLAGLTRKKLNR